MGCITTSVKAGNLGIPGNAIVILNGVEVLADQHYLLPADSLQANAKDTIIYHRKHRAIAALLAFPLLGVFGLHRIYMHTAPGVPFIYIVTAGGLFGVLPFIDFVLILLNKDIHLTYTSNPHLFMWQKR